MSFHPQTPQSPSQLSPGTSDPPTSMNTSLSSVTTALPTPAHSVNGSASQPSDMQHDVKMSEDTPQKRKRSVDDLGDRAQKKAHIEDGKLGIEDLHLDVGEKYLLCKTPHRAQKSPRVTEDLFEMFGLADIAAEVAREKPNGEKNALRKTYKGHIKRLGVMGRFESVEKDWDEPKQLPDQDDSLEHQKDRTDSYFGFGKITTLHDADFWSGRTHLMKGLTPQVKASEQRAFAMAKGPIPVKSFDSSLLGDISAASADLSRQGQIARTTPGTPIGTPGSTTSKPKQQLPGVPRPQRPNQKRRYGDSSFEGYGEGFADDGYSTGDGDDRGGQKRRKKAVGTPQFQNGTPRPSYGSGYTATNPPIPLTPAYTEIETPPRNTSANANTADPPYDAAHDTSQPTSQTQHRVSYHAAGKASFLAAKDAAVFSVLSTGQACASELTPKKRGRFKKDVRSDRS